MGLGVGGGSWGSEGLIRCRSRPDTICRASEARPEPTHWESFCSTLGLSTSTVRTRPTRGGRGGGPGRRPGEVRLRTHLHVPLSVENPTPRAETGWSPPTLQGLDTPFLLGSRTTTTPESLSTPRGPSSTLRVFRGRRAPDV